MRIINRISLGFKEHDILIGENLKNKILDYSYQFSKELKKVLNKKRINYITVIIPVFYQILKLELKKELFDYSFFK